MSDHGKSSLGDVELSSEAKTYTPPQVAAELKSFFRAEGRTTFETDSLELFHKPIDSYEGGHRYVQ